MAKIIKLNVYEKTVYAVQVEDNLYIDELGVKHLTRLRRTAKTPEMYLQLSGRHWNTLQKTTQQEKR